MGLVRSSQPGARIARLPCNARAIPRQAKSPNTVFGPEESAMTTSSGAPSEGVASNVAVKVPVWFANGVLTQVLMTGVVMHTGSGVVEIWRIR